MTTVAAGVTTQIGTDSNMVGWSIKINKGTATVGTLTLTAVSPGATTGEACSDDTKAPIVFNCATSTAQTYFFPFQPADLVIITPSGLDGTYKYSFSQW